MGEYPSYPVYGLRPLVLITLLLPATAQEPPKAAPRQQVETKTEPASQSLGVTIPQPLVIKAEGGTPLSAWVTYGPFVAPVIGMLVTIATLYLTLKHSRDVLAAQHQNALVQGEIEHKRQLERADRDRKATWKRDIYSQAAREIATLRQLGIVVQNNSTLLNKAGTPSVKKDYSDKIIRGMEEMLSRHQTLISLMVTSKGLVADDTTQLLIRLNTSSMKYMVPKSDVDITEQSDYTKELSDVLVKLMYLSEKDLA